MKIAFIAHDINSYAGSPQVTAALIKRFCDSQQVSVFSHTIEGIDLSKIKYHHVPTVAHPRFLKCLIFVVCNTTILARLALLRRKNFDIIHSTEYFCGFQANVLASHFCERECLRLERSNIIDMPHKSISQKLRLMEHMMHRHLMAFVEGSLFAHSSKTLIVISQCMKNDFVHHYGNAAKNIIVIPNGVDLKLSTLANRTLYRDKVRQKYGISRSGLVLMFLGGDWERKGVPCAIEALSLLPRPEVRLFIIGRGDRKFYSHLAELNGVKEKIIFVAQKVNVEEYYAASDIFILPTIYEPFGLVILEAMACGLPVITSRVAGAADLITDGVDGLLLNDPSDTKDLAAKIELLVLNAELRKTMGERARKTAEKLSWEQVAEKTLDVYNSILKQARSLN